MHEEIQSAKLQLLEKDEAIEGLQSDLVRNSHLSCLSVTSFIAPQKIANKDGGLPHAAKAHYVKRELFCSIFHVEYLSAKTLKMVDRGIAWPVQTGAQDQFNTM